MTHNHENNLPSFGETFGLDGFHVNLKGYTTFKVLKADSLLTEALLETTKDLEEKFLVGVRFCFNTPDVKRWLGA